MLVPVVLGVIAAYLATKVSLSGPWTAVARELKIMQLGGNVIESIARRAIERMRREARGKTGNDLWPHVEEAVQEAVQSGVRMLVDIVRSAPMPGQPLRRAAEPAVSGRRAPASSNLPAAERAKAEAAMAPVKALVDPDGDGVYELETVRLENRVLAPANAHRIGEDLALTIAYTAKTVVAGLAGWNKTWHSRSDPRVRRSHAVLNGVKISAREPFRTVDRVEIRYPHDPQAPTSEIAGCRCWLTFGRT